MSTNGNLPDHGIIVTSGRLCICHVCGGLIEQGEPMVYLTGTDGLKKSEHIRHRRRTRWTPVKRSQGALAKLSRIKKSFPALKMTDSAGRNDRSGNQTVRRKGQHDA
jgi:hypothetical protein